MPCVELAGDSKAQGWMGNVLKGEDAPCDGANWKLCGPVGPKIPTRL